VNNQIFDQEIFIAVLGTTPQILTEGIYFYYSDYYRQNRYFDQIKVFTTSVGREILIKTLFKENRLEQLCAALKVDSLPFTPNDIFLMEDKKGSPIEDTRTTEQVEQMSNILYRKIREYTSIDNIRLTATVAGGRKSMSALMALAFQLYARDHDELVHIIAPEAKMDPMNPESKNWFFPENPAGPDEQLDVAIIPVIKVGRYISLDLSKPPQTLIKMIQETILDEAPLDSLIVEGTIIRSGEELFKLQPKKAALYRYLLKKRIHSTCPADCPGCTKCFADKIELIDAHGTDLKAEHEKLLSKYSGYLEMAQYRYSEKAPDKIASYINQELSRLRTAVKNANTSDRFKKTVGIKTRQLNPDNRKDTWYGISVDPNIVTIKK